MKKAASVVSWLFLVSALRCRGHVTTPWARHLSSVVERDSLAGLERSRQILASTLTFPRRTAYEKRFKFSGAAATLIDHRDIDQGATSCAAWFRGASWTALGDLLAAADFALQAELLAPTHVSSCLSNPSPGKLAHPPNTEQQDAITSGRFIDSL